MNVKGKQNLYGLTLAELEEFIQRCGEPKYRAAQVYQWIFKQGKLGIQEMTNLPQQFRQHLQEHAQIQLPVVRQKQLASKDLTLKVLLELDDGHLVEAVLMPYHLTHSRNRLTACISTQVGCPIACPFCATGQVGFVRNLTVDEIVSQVLILKQEAQQIIDPQDLTSLNIVFMGMGEPLLNWSAVDRSLEIFHEPKGLNISWRRMTVSTAGVIPGIQQLSQKQNAVNLAVSLHAANNALRNQLVPLNQRYPLEQLIPACQQYFEQTGRRVTFEYILLHRVNDSVEQAKELASCVRGFPILVNVIPANPTPGKYKQSTPKQTQEFMQTLRNCHVECTLREERGRQISAACGQLRGQMM